MQLPEPAQLNIQLVADALIQPSSAELNRAQLTSVLLKLLNLIGVNVNARFSPVLLRYHRNNLCFNFRGINNYFTYVGSTADRTLGTLETGSSSTANYSGVCGEDLNILEMFQVEFTSIFQI